jgi:hypothetical protein
MKETPPTTNPSNEQTSESNEVTIVPSLKLGLLGTILISVGYAIELYANKLEIDEAVEEQRRQNEITKALEDKFQSIQQQLSEMQQKLDKINKE